MAEAVELHISNKLSPTVWKVIAVVMLGPIMTQMDSTIVNVSLSTIQADLNASISSAQWVISSYLLALALMLPLNGWLIDRVGAKRIYLFCFFAFTISSVLCGMAQTMPELICARVLQGMAGGLLAPLTQLMMARIAGKQMARAMGYAAIPILMAPIFGPVVAGAILKVARWPWLFYVNLPIGTMALVLAAWLLPADKNETERRPFDFFGFMLISPGLVGLLLGFDRSAQNADLWVLPVGFFLIVGFIVYASRKGYDALVDIRLFRNKTFAAAAATQFLTNGIMYAGQFLIPLFLINGWGLNAQQAGWLVAPMGIGMLCVYPFMGFLTDRFGVRNLALTGITVNFLGTLPLVWMSQSHFSMMVAGLSVFVRGLGQGCTGIPSLSAAYGAVAVEELSSATTAMNIVMRLGGPIATTTTAIILSLSGKYWPQSGGKVFLVPFLALVFYQLLVLSTASFLPKKQG